MFGQCDRPPQGTQGAVQDGAGPAALVLLSHGVEEPGCALQVLGNSEQSPCGLRSLDLDYQGQRCPLRIR